MIHSNAPVGGTSLKPAVEPDNIQTLMPCMCEHTLARSAFLGGRTDTKIVRYHKNMYFFVNVKCFVGKNGCDCEDKTYSNCYVLKYLEIVLPDTLNPLKHIGTSTNCTTIGTFTLLLIIVLCYCFNF